MLAYRLKNTAHYSTEKKSHFAKLKAKYIAYCVAEQRMHIYWYLKAIIIITCVYMVPSIIVMALATDYYVYYIGLTIILFYSNMLAHISGLKSKHFVPIYHLTCLIMVLTPMITLLLFGMNGTMVTF